jgi:hypothetical protein
MADREVSLSLARDARKTHQEESSGILVAEETKIAPVAMLYRSSWNMNASKKQYMAVYTSESHLRGEKPFLVPFKLEL